MSVQNLDTEDQFEDQRPGRPSVGVEHLIAAVGFGIGMALLFGAHWLRSSIEEVTAVLTAVLVAVTGIYAALTKGMSDAAARQANASEEQLAQAKIDYEAEQKARKSAQEHADKLFDESVLAREYAVTPICTVELMDGTLHNVGGPRTAVGRTPRTDFDADGRIYNVRLVARVHNHGPGPALVTASSLPSSVMDVDSDVDSVGDELLVKQDRHADVIWLVIRDGPSLSSGDPLPAAVITTRSPLSSATIDEHSVVATYELPVLDGLAQGDATVLGQQFTVTTGRVSPQRRTRPTQSL